MPPRVNLATWSALFAQLVAHKCDSVSNEIATSKGILHDPRLDVMPHMCDTGSCDI